MKKYLIIYHRDDNDGVFSGAIFLDYLINILKVDREEIDTMGADYNTLSKFSSENTPKSLHEKYEHIIITDLSFNDASYMKALYDEFKADFIWCDHHAPIIKESHFKNFDDAPGIRDTGRSAILCVYKFLYDQSDEFYNDKGSKLPEIFRILSAWDSWTYEKAGYTLDYVMKVNKGVTFTYNLDIEKAASDVRKILLLSEITAIRDAKIWLLKLVPEMEKIGTIICEYDARNAAGNISRCGDCSWKIVLPDGSERTACALFIQGASNSQMFASVKERIQNGIVFKRNSDGSWAFSLYNTDNQNDFHCGEFLKEKYGGGGHPGAAGATLSEEKFIEVLKKKIL